MTAIRPPVPCNATHSSATASALAAAAATALLTAQGSTSTSTVSTRRNGRSSSPSGSTRPPANWVCSGHRCEVRARDNAQLPHQSMSTAGSTAGILTLGRAVSRQAPLSDGSQFVHVVRDELLFTSYFRVFHGLPAGGVAIHSIGPDGAAGPATADCRTAIGTHSAWPLPQPAGSDRGSDDGRPSELLAPTTCVAH